MRDKFSRFVHFFEKDGNISAYNALNHDLVFIKKKDLRQIKKALSSGSQDSSVEKSVANLKERGMIISSNESDDKQLIELQKSILSTPWINTLYLLITNKCNFRCTYCFFEGSYSVPGTKSVHMAESTAIEAINKFADYLKKAEQYSGVPALRPSVIFYGGEPFLNKNVFKSAVNEINILKAKGMLPSDTMINVNSNGSVITDDIAEFCAKHDIEVDVSLDGYQSVHDINRVWQNKKKGTFAEVMRGINRLKKAGTKICISCTVAEGNVDVLPEIFRWFIDELNMNSIGFNPLLDSHQYQIRDFKYHQKVARAMIECYKIARERGFYEERIMRKVRAFVDGTIYDRDCCGCGQQVVVAPDGSMGVCHAYIGDKKYFVSSDNDFNPYEHPFWKEWSRRSPINIPECHICEALTFCGGGCPHNADVQQGSIWKLDKGFCVHAKETLEWLIWDLHANMK